jgi:hypothetical protein
VKNAHGYFFFALRAFRMEGRVFPPLRPAAAFFLLFAIFAASLGWGYGTATTVTVPVSVVVLPALINLREHANSVSALDSVSQVVSSMSTVP